jgi:hypothetical protein
MRNLLMVDNVDEYATVCIAQKDVIKSCHEPSLGISTNFILMDSSYSAFSTPNFNSVSCYTGEGSMSTGLIKDYFFGPELVLVNYAVWHLTLTKYPGSTLLPLLSQTTELGEQRFPLTSFLAFLPSNYQQITPECLFLRYHWSAGYMVNRRINGKSSQPVKPMNKK